MEDKTPYETWGYLTKSFQDNHPHLAYIHFVEPRTNMLGEKNTETPDSLDPFRKAWKGVFISTGGYTYDRYYTFDTTEKTGSLITFGRQFLANPDLVERLRNSWLVNKYNSVTFHGGNTIGYTDYSFYKE